MKRWAVAGGVCAALTVAVAAPDTTPPEAVAAFERGNCNLCHTTPGVSVAPQTESCTGCHIWIRKTSRNAEKREAAMKIFPQWERYERNIRSYVQVPSLDAGFARLKPEWVEAWLADPYDVRPGLDEGMPRFALSAEERSAIADVVRSHNATVENRPKPRAENMARGRELLSERACTSCHGFGTAVPATPGISMAPDLAHTRDRMTADMTVAWILNPRSIAPSASMPSFGLTADEAIAVRDFLFLADPDLTVPEPRDAAIEPTKAPVTWAMVEERVFGKICAHCHMDPDNPSSQGRRGPGNAGGFGFPETGIHLQSREGVMAVADRIGPSLMRRRVEAARDHLSRGAGPQVLTRPEKPGMPLGLPPLPDEDIALVLGWIEQGFPE